VRRCPTKLREHSMKDFGTRSIHNASFSGLGFIFRMDRGGEKAKKQRYGAESKFESAAWIVLDSVGID